MLCCMHDAIHYFTKPNLDRLKKMLRCLLMIVLNFFHERYAYIYLNLDDLQQFGQA
jgi:hypothetical protein